MNISLEDFNALSAEQSQREVRIAKLEMELQLQTAKHAEEVAVLRSERDALWGENNELREQVHKLEMDYENVRFENHWMKQYILLSVERVRDFFSHIRDFAVLAAIKSFVLDMLPPNATPEQIAYTRDVMQFSLTDDASQKIEVSGDYVVTKHVEQEVGRVDTGAIGFTIN